MSGGHRAAVTASKAPDHGVDIGPLGDGRLPELLGRDVGERAHRTAGLAEPGTAGIHGVGDSKVTQQGPVVGQEDVGGLDVPVDQVVAMCGA